MINQLRLQHFKNHQDTSIQFGRLTALVGPNSSGKTSILQALHSLHKLSQGNSCKSVFHDSTDPSVLIHSGERNLSICLAGEEKSENWSVDVDLHISSDESQRRYPDELNWEPRISWNWNDDRYEITSFSTVLFNQSAGSIPDILGGIVFLKAIGDNLSRPSYTEAIPPQLSSHGANLASVIAYLRTTEPERLERLESHLQSVVSAVEGIRTRPKMISYREPRRVRIKDEDVSYSEERRFRADELLFDMIGAKGVPAYAVSEGTLIATGLLAALLGTEQAEPRMLLIDDIEQGLHPKAQRDLVAVLRKILDSNPNLQILFTTHSPYIVDELEASETWLLATDQQGIAHTKRLSEHPDANRALDVLTTGEFWSAEGEEWIVENA